MLRGKDVMLAQAALGLSRWSLVWCGVVWYWIYCCQGCVQRKGLCTT